MGNRRGRGRGKAPTGKKLQLEVQTSRQPSPSSIVPPAVNAESASSSSSVPILSSLSEKSAQSQAQSQTHKVVTRAANKHTHPGAIVAPAPRRTHAEMTALRAQKVAQDSADKTAQLEALQRVAALQDQMQLDDIQRSAIADHPIDPDIQVPTRVPKRHRDPSPIEPTGSDSDEDYNDGGRPDSDESSDEENDEVDGKEIVVPARHKRKVKSQTRREDIQAARVIKPVVGTPMKLMTKQNSGPAPPKRHKPSKPLSGLNPNWQNVRSCNTSMATVASGGTFDNDSDPVQYGGPVPDNETGDAERATLGLEKVKMNSMIKVEHTLTVLPATKKQIRGGANKWTHDHLPRGTVEAFKTYVVRLARIQAGAMEPWAGLTTVQIQGIVDQVYGVDEYEVKENDVWCGLIGYRLHDWRSSFGQNGIKTVTKLIEDNTEVLNSQTAIAEAINEYLTIPKGQKSAPFQWQEFNGGTAKKGLLQSHLILRVFAHTYLLLFDDPFELLRMDKPVGALLLAMQAVQRALSFWKTGELVVDTSPAGRFSFDNYGDKTTVDKVTKQLTLHRRATLLLASINYWDDDYWHMLIKNAAEHLEDFHLMKRQASSTSRPSSEVFDVDADFVLHSDPEDDGDASEPYSAFHDSREPE
ncbi:hypothetical protein H0H92_001622 [Tricholoma furcatifolium]|nr:hypothetical protein H0H92_001622 [Tricholoma furcatifolium]